MVLRLLAAPGCRSRRRAIFRRVRVAPAGERSPRPAACDCQQGNRKLVIPLDQFRAGVSLAAQSQRGGARPPAVPAVPCRSRASNPAGCIGRSPTRSATLIGRGEFPAGARLPPERDLAKQLGVSRPSVREALIALEVEGLVEVRIGSGIYVLGRHGERAAQPRRRDECTRRPGPFELLRARYVIESECAALAAKSAKKAQVGAIAEALDADAARDRRASSSRWAATGCSTCASPRRPATARWSRSSRCCGTSARARSTSSSSTTTTRRRCGGRDDRAPRRAEGDRGARRAGARAAMQRHLNQAYKRFSTRVGHACSSDAESRRSRRRTPCLPAASTPRKTCGSNPSTRPTPGPGEVLLRLGAGGICGSDLHYYFEGRNGSFVVREPLIPGHEASAVVAAVGAGVTRVKVGRQGRGVAVARLRPLRILPRGPRAAVLEHALPRQRQPVPARAGDVPGILRDGRAPVLSGRRRHLAGRARVRRAAGGGAARASTAAATCSASRC